MLERDGGLVLWDEGGPIRIPKEHLFLGTCMGVGLVPRGRNDMHICFVILTEDDGNWFVSKRSDGSSIYWLGDLMTQLGRVVDWLGRYAAKDSHGYRFK